MKSKKMVNDCYSNLGICDRDLIIFKKFSW